jgi:class 3 adenylate cyclase
VGPELSDREFVARVRFRNISVATRIATAIIVIAVGALAVTLVYGTIVRDNLTRTSLDARFSAATTAKADELGRYVDSLTADALQLASSPMTADASRRFARAYSELPAPDSLNQKLRTAVLADYREVYVPALTEARARPVAIGDVSPATDGARYLQGAYLGVALLDEVQAVSIDDAKDGSSWSEVHAEVHPAFRASAIAYGFEDVLLIDPSSFTIMYSVAKKADFGTSLEIGPVGGTALSALAQQIMRDPSPGTVIAADFSRYDPDIAAPVAFVGSPVYDGTELVAILVIKVTPDRMTEITTQGEDWSAMRLGNTGEIYVVGPEGRTRTDSRLFLEDRAAYFTEATAAGTITDTDVAGIESAGTTAWFQRMDPSTLRAVERSPGEMADSKSYLGRDVFTTLEPIGDGPLGWSLVVQVERAEALAKSVAAERLGSVAVAIFVLLLTFAAVSWAASFIRPIVVLSLRLRALVAGTESSGRQALLAKEQTRTTSEFADLTDTVDGMLMNLDEREQAAARAESERIDVVRRFLPEDAARQIETDERSIERVTKASVVSVAVSGFERMVETEPTEVVRERFESVVSTLDQMAREHGLKRVKVIGDMWVGVCGLDTPHVDHVARSVALAADALGVRVGPDDGDSFGITVGVAAGPVSAGLAGSSRLIYDAWGETVNESNALAMVGQPGDIVVSASVIGQLPAAVEVEDVAIGDSGTRAWKIVPDTAGSGVAS